MEKSVFHSRILLYRVLESLWKVKWEIFIYICLYFRHSDGIKVFSSCSVEDFNNYMKLNGGYCLSNRPHLRQHNNKRSAMSSPFCGNHIIETGENCDCGSPQVSSWEVTTGFVWICILFWMFRVWKDRRVFLLLQFLKIQDEVSCYPPKTSPNKTCLALLLKRLRPWLCSSSPLYWCKSYFMFILSNFTLFILSANTFAKIL